MSKRPYTENERIYNKAYRQKHIDRYKAYDQIKNKLPKYRYRQSLSNAKKRNLCWEISYEDFVKNLETPCYYCQGRMNNPSQHGCHMDRIDNDKGYTLDNILPCCGSCNRVRGLVLTVEETKLAIEVVLAHRAKQTE